MSNKMNSVHFCNWEWCRETYTNHEDLVSHVLAQHVEEATPVRRSDVRWLRRVEESSATSEGLPTFPGFTQSLDTQQQSGSSLLPDETRSVRAVTPVRSKRPTFSDVAALSSPENTPSVASPPATPQLSTMIANAFPKPPFSRPHAKTTIVHHASHSTSTSSSRAVEEQLTQNMPPPSTSVSPAKPGSPLKQNFILPDVPQSVNTGDAGGAPLPPASQSAVPLFRSGSLRIHRTSSQAPPFVDLSQRTDAAPPAGSSYQSQTQTSLYQLQTQAPYASQTTGSQTSS
ncbi:hypothetical protein BV25DRAFT_836194 [Artomyces pyxidatus]|uniref:Uncharacterized protein n=1 Tax=Artomyces pyxidatus TaxID=48021 RepID=A0ACB8TGL9_9AGAM|nr:hypothetical protein BV25DRAFT_836194 [Artomyces pyxidatus]